MPSAAAPLAETDEAEGLRLFLWQGALTGCYYAAGMPASAALVGFALDIVGMSRENAGLIGAAMYSAAIFQFLSFLLTNRVADKKRFVVVVGALEMAVLSAALFVPLVLGPAARGRLWSQGAFLACLFLSSACLHLSQPLFASWMSALIPARRRGRYLGARQVLITGCQTVMIALVLYALGPHPTWGMYAAAIAGCCLAGVIGYSMLARAPMPQVSVSGLVHWQDLRASWEHRPFRQYLVFIVPFFTAFSLACAYYGPFYLKEVGMSLRQISWYIVGHNVVMLLCLRPTGRLVDRFGSRPIMAVMIGIYAAFYLSFPFVSLPRLWLVVTAWSVVGIADAMYCVAVTSTLYHSLPPGPQRTGCLALAQGAVLLCMGAGPFLVRLYLALSPPWRLELGGAVLEPFRLMFAVCGLAMLASLLPARHLSDTHDVRLGEMLTDLLKLRPFRLLPHLHRRDRD